MLKSCNYYTPEIWEFHYGFDYEIFENWDVPGAERTWHKQSYGIDGTNPENMGHVYSYYFTPSEPAFEQGRLRVKKLDREDIIAQGWGYKEQEQEIDIHFSNTLRSYRGHLLTLHHNPISRWVLITEVDPNRHFMPRTQYAGHVRNKSHLAQLMKDLGIA